MFEFIFIVNTSLLRTLHWGGNQMGAVALKYDAGFDDLLLEQTGSMIVQEQHQYAYGSSLAGLSYIATATRDSTRKRTRKRGWESFELRLYNARIGRWMVGMAALPSV